MDVFRFERSTILSASPEAVFGFHEDPRNIRRIAPASLKVRRVECSVPATPGGRFEMDVVQLGFPIRWIGEWETVEPPSRLVDIAIRSPFSIWRHAHLFDADPAGCRLTDRVECQLKGGVGGRLIGRIVLPVLFASMFRARHAATREWFSSTRA
ncbi:MAG: SRPBCC family protein [Terrimicrobiaceae bacterium]|nr:SRPBCC family protein [Terrimicrobiaceae bacterium]